MIENVKDFLNKRKTNTQRLRKEAPDIFEGFNELIKHYYKSDVLNRKQRELMAVACSTAQQCVPWLANHANNALVAGATRDEILAASAIGIEFGGGPAFVVVRDNLLHFLDELEK